MPRIRSIHPDALKSEKLAASSAEAERLYWRLQTHCDDDGRSEDDPRLFRSFLFPLHEDITTAMVDAWLAELEAVGLVIRYASDDGRFLAVTRWEEYQHPQRKTNSKLPPPPRGVRECAASGTRGVEAGEGEGEGVGDTARPPKKRNAIFDALVEVFGETATRTEAGFYGSVSAELKEAGATPADVVERGRRMLSKGWKDATPKALAKHWSALGAAEAPGPDDFTDRLARGLV